MAGHLKENAGAFKDAWKSVHAANREMASELRDNVKSLRDIWTPVFDWGKTEDSSKPSEVQADTGTREEEGKPADPN